MPKSLVAALCILGILAPTAVKANLLSAADAAKLLELEQRANEIMANWGELEKETGTDSKLNWCIGDLTYLADAVANNISGIANLVLISSSMHSSEDERVVNDRLTAQTHGTLDNLAVIRALSRAPAKRCADNATITSRANRLRDWIDETETALKSLQQRLQTK